MAGTCLRTCADMSDDQRPDSALPDAKLKVTQVRSKIGSKPKARGTLRALGLGTIGDSNVLPDRPEIRGMIARVPHLIKVETVTTTSEKK